MTTQPATIYLLRWDPVVGNPQGIFNLTLREGAVRGPVAPVQPVAQTSQFAPIAHKLQYAPPQNKKGVIPITNHTSESVTSFQYSVTS